MLAVWVLPYNDFLVIQLISILFFAACIPVAGIFADKFGRKPTMLVITALMIAFGLLFGWWLNADIIVNTDGSLNTMRMVLFMIAGMALMGLTFGPMSAILPELFPTETRYTGSGIAYNVSSILGAALTPFIATWLMGTMCPISAVFGRCISYHADLLGAERNKTIAFATGQIQRIINVDWNYSSRPRTHTVRGLMLWRRASVLSCPSRERISISLCQLHS